MAAKACRRYAQSLPDSSEQFDLARQPSLAGDEQPTAGQTGRCLQIRTLLRPANLCRWIGDFDFEVRFAGDNDPMDAKQPIE